MPEPKAQLIDPQGPIDVPGLSVTGVTTATGGFVGAVQGTATGFAATTYNLNVGIVTATKFQGNTTGNVSGLADGTNINVGIITSTSFTGDLVGNAAGLSTTTANINAGIMSATSFAGNFTGVASGITGTPNIVVGIMTGTLKGDGSSLTGIAATNWITNNVTANSSTTAIDLALGNVVKFTQSANTTVSFANTGTSNIVTFIRTKDATSTERTLTWPSAINWDGGSAPTLDQSNIAGTDVQQFQLLTRDEGVTWYGWETFATSTNTYTLWSWGYNYYGYLGQNNRTAKSSPVQIPGNNWRSIAGGTKSVKAAMASKVDGTLWSWGNNSYGQLGLNNTTRYSSPVQIPGTTWSGRITMSDDYSTLATKTDGTLWAWGLNEKGQLGQNDKTQRNAPVQVGTDTTWEVTNPQRMAAVGGAMLAIKTDGTLWAWGANSQGVWGSNQSHPTHRSSPVQVGSETTWDVISPGSYFISALKTDGTLWTWGWNDAGQLGDNSRVNRSSPVQVPGTWGGMNVGYKNVFAVNTSSELWAWGSNNYGMLGQNEKSPQRYGYSSPVQIPGTEWTAGTGEGALYGTTFLGRTDGTVWAMGTGNPGVLGINQSGGPAYYSSPVQIPGTNWVGDIKGTVSGCYKFAYGLRKAT